MALPRIAPTVLVLVLVLVLAAGCGGDGTAAPARAPAEAVAERLKGSAGVRVTRHVRLDHGKVDTPPADDLAEVGIGEYDESRTTGVLGEVASDLTTTYYRTNVPAGLAGVVPTDLSHLTTRTITIAGAGSYEHRADRRDVPAGKPWLHGDGSRCEWLRRATGSLRLRDLVSPGTLGRLTAPDPVPGEVVDGAETVVHAGSASPADLVAAAPSDDPVLFALLRERIGSAEVSWRLWVGLDGLPRRVRLTWAYPEPGDGEPRSAVAEVGFTGWGGETRIEPPPPDQVRESDACVGPEPD
ncbi:hypothetical protein MF672_041325 [Actinomadura sp. ATCC 31491]|uniref:LppX_LprAFG lipoprotein n=1 Tax=Actinomadura luzonensis TaxID=2805427 RepID=A0ABT0G6F3_9ACTN|nr:hypothetical protein [Actinomadura luzonensis]MCK2220197.1 hypothetical protein [Actinomadura luzonensis]